MLGAVATSTTLWLSPSIHPSTFTFLPRFNVHKRISNSTLPMNHGHSFTLLSAPPLHFSFYSSSRRQTHLFAEAASSSSSGQILWSLIYPQLFYFFSLFSHLISHPTFQFQFLCLSLFLQLPLGMHLPLSWEINNAEMGNKL